MPPEVPFDPSLQQAFMPSDLTPNGERRRVYEERIVPETHRLLTFSSDDYVGYIIGTQSRMGCDSVGIWRVDPEGRDEVFMSHYEHPEATWEAIEQAAPRGKGRIKAVYLTPRLGDEFQVQETSDVVFRTTGVRPDIVTVPIPGDMTSLRENFVRRGFQYQLLALRMYPTISTKRILIPGTNYDLHF